MSLIKRMMEEHEASVARGYSIPESDERFLCSCHYENTYLKDFIRRNGNDGTCTYCGRKGLVIDFADFVGFIGGRLSDYLEDIDDAGLPSAKLFFDNDDEEIPGLTRRGYYIAPEDAEYFESTEEAMYDFGLISDSEELDGDLSSHLFLEDKIRRDPTAPLLSDELSFLWKQFCDLVKKQQRYTFFKSPLFERAPMEYSAHGLEDILSELGNLIHMVEEVLPVETLIYRCRPARKEDVVSGFRDLTAPPVSKAKSNRMSPTGISMFYGSFEKETPIKETRHYSKDPLAYVGKFRTTRKLLVINLCSAPEADFWMPSGWQEYGFLNSFHQEISKPIGPNDVDEIEYVPSQVFTEYLRYLCKNSRGEHYDGIIYRSAMTNKKNIVLFYDQESSSSILELMGCPEEIEWGEW